MPNKDASVTIILTNMLVGERRRCHSTAWHHGEVADSLESSSLSSHAPKRPHRGMGPSKWVLGWLFRGGVLEGENLSAHVQLAYVMRLLTSMALCQLAQAGRHGGEEDRSLNLDAADSSAAGRAQLAYPAQLMRTICSSKRRRAARQRTMTNRAHTLPCARATSLEAALR